MWTHITYACFHLHFRWVLICCESVCRPRTTALAWIPPRRGEAEDFRAHIWSCRNSPAVLSVSAAVYSHSRHVQAIPSRPSQRGHSDGAIKRACSLSEREAAVEPHPEEHGDPFREKQQWLVWISLTSVKAHGHTQRLICTTTMKQQSFCQVLSCVRTRDMGRIEKCVPLDQT